MAIGFCTFCKVGGNVSVCSLCDRPMSFDEPLERGPLGMSEEKQTALEEERAREAAESRARHLETWESPTSGVMFNLSSAEANIEHAMQEMENAPDIEEYMNHLRAALAILKPRIKKIIENRKTIA